MAKILLDLDMDYFNYIKNPSEVLGRLLSKVPKNVPAVVVIEHQTILPYVKEWVRGGLVPIPFKWIHMDQHHDFYQGKSKPVHCGNFGFFMPTKYYNKFTWVAQSRNSRVDDDWEFMSSEWIRKNGKRVSEHYDRQPMRKEDSVIGMVIAISPDYIDYPEFVLASMLAIINNHFNLKTIPLPRQNRRGREQYEERKWVSSWKRSASDKIYEWRKRLCEMMNKEDYLRIMTH
jgi:hypothetical protein